MTLEPMMQSGRKAAAANSKGGRRMNRKVRPFGAALAAVLAMSAFASAASAAEFHSPAATTNIHLGQKTVNVWGSTAGNVTCETATFKGLMTAKTQASLQWTVMKFE